MRQIESYQEKGTTKYKAHVIMLRQTYASLLLSLNLAQCCRYRYHIYIV